MGTNYYAQKEPTNVCPTCGRHDEVEQIHIGKSSGGWCFALHVIPERGLNTLEDWKTLLAAPGMEIRDEYDRKLTLDELLRVITKRGYGIPLSDKTVSPWYASWDDFHRQNHSEEGPEGLIRSRADGRHCVGHGEGTWDYMVGEFS